MSSKLRNAVAAAFAAAAFTAVAPAFAQEKVQWKMPTAFSFDWPALGDTAKWFSERIEAASGGNVQLRAYEPGKLVPAFQILDAVKDKKVEAGYTWLGYDQGKIASAPLFAAVPFGLEPWEFTAWWYQDGGEKFAHEIYAKHNAVPLLCGIMGPEGAGWFRKEIKSLEDLKGLKIRFAGLGGEVMQKAGASVTVLPGAEIFPALEKGAIDATEFSMPAIDEKIGFQKLVKNYYFPAWHQPFTAMHLLVNKELWDKTGKANKAAIENACMAATLKSLSRGEAAQPPALKNLQAQGVKLQSLPEKVLRELEKLTEQVMQEKAAKDPDFKKVYEHQRAFEKSYKVWKDKAYLPRNW